MMKEGRSIDLLNHTLDVLKEELGVKRVDVFIQLSPTDMFLQSFNYENAQNIKRKLEADGWQLKYDKKDYGDNREIKMAEPNDRLRLNFSYKPDRQFKLNELAKQKEEAEKRIAEIQAEITKEKQNYLEEDVVLFGGDEDE